MRELLYLTGQINSPFFTNEISYFCSSFDKVHVLAYGEDKAECEKLSSKYGFTYEFVNTLGNRLKNVLSLFGWGQRDYVKEEKRLVKNGNWLKKLLYIYYYGIYSVTVERIIKKRLPYCDELYLYSFWLSRPAFAISSMNINRNSKIKRIASRAHRYDIYEEENRLNYLPFRRFIADNIDVLYFSSKDTYDYFTDKSYSENAGALYKFSYLGTNKPQYTKKEKNFGKIVIASCAYIIQRKRLDLIIDLVSELAKYNIEIKWIHIGDGELENQIQSLAQEKLRPLSVEYVFTGKMKDNEIYELYYSENVDFFVNMSDSEGLPVSIMEAISMGIPVIARDVGGIKDAVINGKTGILINKDEIEIDCVKEVAKRMIQIFSESVLYNEYSLNARSHWEKMFDSENNAKKVCLDIIDQNRIDAIE